MARPERKPEVFECSYCGRTFPADQMTRVGDTYYCPDHVNEPSAQGAAGEDRGARWEETRRGREQERPLTAVEPMIVPASGFAIASLVLGIVGVLLFLVPGIGIISSILAVIFGISGLVQVSGQRRTGAGIAWAGLILGVIGVLLFAGTLFGILSGFGG